MTGGSQSFDAQFPFSLLNAPNGANPLEQFRSSLAEELGVYYKSRFEQEISGSLLRPVIEEMFSAGNSRGDAYMQKSDQRDAESRARFMENFGLNESDFQTTAKDSSKALLTTEPILLSDEQFEEVRGEIPTLIVYMAIYKIFFDEVQSYTEAIRREYISDPSDETDDAERELIENELMKRAYVEGVNQTHTELVREALVRSGSGDCLADFDAVIRERFPTATDFELYERNRMTAYFKALDAQAERFLEGELEILVGHSMVFQTACLSFIAERFLLKYDLERIYADSKSSEGLDTI